MKRILKKQIDSLLKRDKRSLKYVEITYENGSKVQFTSQGHINWGKIITHATVVFNEPRYEYVGFYEDDSGGGCPILVPRNKVKIRPRKCKE